MIKKITNISDQGIICDFGEEVNKEINREVIGLFNYLKNKNEKEELQGIYNIIPSYNKLVVHFDLEKNSSQKIKDFIAAIDLKNSSIAQKNKTWTIPICYDDEFALDLENLTKSLKLSKDEIVNTHLQTEFYVYMIGFMPGHPYMGDLDKKLFTSRLQSPRIQVPIGSVAIAEKFCIIYPYQSPGGWNIIGRTSFKLFDTKNLTNPCLVSPGDTVKFKRVNKKDLV
jgi:inhibitor of KinA